MNLLQFKNVYYNSDEKSILKNISFNIEKGDFISIIGPSGSGKSTLLKLSSHLISPSNGTILYKGKDLLEYNPMRLRQNICYCFQIPHLFGKDVRENLIFPYNIRNSNVDFKRIEYLLRLFNLDKDILNRQVEKLSGGEKQRICLIRSLLITPDVLLLDEVTSALDTENTVIVEKAIKKINEDGTTILWVTHNLEQSKKFANKVLTIESGQIKSLEVLK